MGHVMDKFDDDWSHREVQDGNGCAFDRSDDENTDGDGDGVDMVVLARRYRAALADFRLHRAQWLLPCVAAVISGAFVLFDPVGLMELCASESAGERYDGAAARMWDSICDALFDSIGDEAGVVSVSREQVALFVWAGLFAEFEGAHATVSEACYADDDQFGAIIAAEFGEDVADDAQFVEFHRDRGLCIDSEKVSAMVDIIHARCGRLPLDWTIDED